MKKKFASFIALIAALFFGGCATVKPTTSPLSTYAEGYTRLDQSLCRTHYREREQSFHPDNYRYYDPLYPSATWVSMVKDSGAIRVTMQTYQDSLLRIDLEPQEVENYLSAIETFFGWAELAEQRGDFFQKEIYRNKVLSFSLFTHNGREQLLEIAPLGPLAGTKLRSAAQYFPISTVVELYELLQLQAKGELQAQTMDSIYQI